MDLKAPLGIDVDPITTDVWVAEAGTFTGTGHNVTVISEKTFTVTATLTGLPTSPLDVAVNTKTNRAYVTFNPFCCSNGPINGGLVVINDKDHKPLATISPIQDPRGVAVDPLTNMIYVASFGTTFPFNCGCVIVIDGNTNVIVTTIPVPEGPLAIAVDPVTNRIYTGDYTNEVTVIDGSTNTVITNVAVAGSQALVGLGVGVNAATNRIYVSRYFGTNDVFVIDGSTNAVIADIPVGPQSNVSGGIGVDSVTNNCFSHRWLNELSQRNRHGTFRRLWGCRGCQKEPSLRNLPWLCCHRDIRRLERTITKQSSFFPSLLSCKIDPQLCTLILTTAE